MSVDVDVVVDLDGDGDGDVAVTVAVTASYPPLGTGRERNPPTAALVFQSGKKLSARGITTSEILEIKHPPPEGEGANPKKE